MGALGQAALAGQVLGGQYRVEHLLGEGGYGIVYAATDLSVGRRVALKILRSAWDSGHAGRSAVARFTREAELVKRLAHPNTVRLVGFGELESGYPYIAYELLDGASLERALAQQGRMAPIRVRRIARQILSALAEAHGLGIVHRDIKPANVFLCAAQGETDFVKLLDFGVAAARFAPEGQSLTQEGMTIGTPAYMAPEQVFGSHIDARTDLYAVGLVIAEMLAGRPVFHGGSGMQIAMEQVSARPVPLPREVVTSELIDVVRIATEKDASRRYASAFEMMREIDRTPTQGNVGVSHSAEAFAATSAIPSHDTVRSNVAQSGLGSNEAPSGFAPTAPTPAAMGYANAVRAKPPSRRGVVIGIVAAGAAAVAASAGTWAWMTQSEGKGRRGARRSSADETAEESDESGDTWETDELDESLRPMVEHWEREAKRLDGVAITPFVALPDDEDDDGVFDLAAFSVQGTSGTQIVARMRKNGWERVSVNPMGGPATRSYAYRNASGESAQLSFSSVGSPPLIGVTKRSGNYTVTLYVNDRRGGANEAAAKRLLDELLRS